MYDRGTADRWAALCTWADTDGMPDLDKFEEPYRGAFAGGFEEFAYQLIDEIGLVDGWPKTAKNYFNYYSYIRDPAMDFTVVKALTHGPDTGSTYVWVNY